MLKKGYIMHYISEMFTCSCRAFRIYLLILLSEIVIIVGLDLNKNCQYGLKKKEKGWLRISKWKYIEHYFLCNKYN